MAPAFFNIVVTDERGQFWAADISGGASDIQVCGPPPPDAVLPKNVRLTLAPGERRRDFRIVCLSGTLVTGRLVEAGPGRASPSPMRRSKPVNRADA